MAVTLHDDIPGSDATVTIRRVYTNGASEWVEVILDSGVGDRYGVTIRDTDLIAAIQNCHDPRYGVEQPDTGRRPTVDLHLPEGHTHDD